MVDWRVSTVTDERHAVTDGARPSAPPRVLRNGGAKAILHGIAKAFRTVRSGVNTPGPHGGPLSDACCASGFLMTIDVIT
jgi:hypothetical protein